MDYNLYLDRTNLPETYVMLYIRINGISVKTSTGIKISPSNCVRVGTTKISGFKKSYTYYSEKKEQLEKFIDYLKDFERRNNLDNQLTEKDIKEAIQQYKKPNQLKKLNVIELYKYFIEQRKSQKELQFGKFKAFSKSTVNNYSAFLYNLELIDKETEIKLGLTYLSSNEFFNYLTNYLIKKNLNINTISIYVKTLKVFLNWCVKNGHLKGFNPVQWAIEQDESPMFALSNAELKLFIDADLTKYPSLENARNLFIIQCYSGLRYSDLKRLTNDNFDLVHNSMTIRTQKTDTPITIPIHNQFKVFLNNIKFEILYFTTISRYNENLKMIGKIIELTEKTKQYTYINGKRKDIMVEKYRLLSSHLARRTFVTDALRKGIRPELIMKITGHKKLASFERYIKFTENEAHDAFMEAYK